MSPEQTPPTPPIPPEGLHLSHDMRFTNDFTDALSGEAGLAGDTVEITGYLGTREEDQGIKHYMKYDDAQGEKKFTTLDQFVWSHLSEDRKDQLKEAGIDPQDMDAGTASIFQKPDSNVSPTEVDTESLSLIHRIAAESGREGANMAIAEVFGRRREGKERSSQESKKSQRVRPEDFAQRVADKIRKYSGEDTANHEPYFAENRENIVKAHELEQLAGLAEIISRQIQKQAEESKDSNGGQPSKIYDPEVTVVHRWNERLPRAMNRLTRIERVQPVTQVHTDVQAEGWLLARTASVMNNRTIVQEVILGVDGKLYAYASADTRYIERLMKGPLSRKQVQKADQAIGQPQNTELSNLPLTGGVKYDERADPTPKNLHVVDGSQYPLPGIGGGKGAGHIFADPAVIQEGLEDLVVEKNIRLTDNQ